MGAEKPVEPYFPERVSLGPDEVVVITGGSGFLGQHIVRILQERADGIKEIRIVDIEPFKQKLNYEEVYPVEFYKADITLENNLDAAFSGATTVIHSAAIIDVGHYVNRARMRSVNIIGTSNVVFKCRQWSVSKLILTSSVDAVFQKNSSFVYQTEASTELPWIEENFRMGFYGFTKAQAEAILICGRNRPLANGKQMKTTILRLTALYGELDTNYIPIALKAAKNCGGYLIQPTTYRGGSIFQCTYVGNAAWAHVLALGKLRNEEKNEIISTPKTNSVLEMGVDLRKVDGEEIFISDDTRPTYVFDFIRPFLALKGFTSLKVPVPVSFVIAILLLMNWLIQNLFPISWRKYLNNHPEIPTLDTFLMTHSAVHVNRLKSTTRLEYKPIYSEARAKEMCSRYYLDVPI